MKNGKRPNKRQKQVLRAHGMDMNAFLIIKDMPDRMEVVRRTDLKRLGKPRVYSLAKGQRTGAVYDGTIHNPSGSGSSGGD